MTKWILVNFPKGPVVWSGGLLVFSGCAHVKQLITEWSCVGDACIQQTEGVLWCLMFTWSNFTTLCIEARLLLHNANMLPRSYNQQKGSNIRKKQIWICKSCLVKSGVFLNFACSLREKAGLVTLRFKKKESVLLICCDPAVFSWFWFTSRGHERHPYCLIISGLFRLHMQVGAKRSQTHHLCM